MIDKFLYNLFGKIDEIFQKVDEVLTFDFPNCKKKKKNGRANK
jgi:hypothetical protein